jgi:hypothetical protein
MENYIYELEAENFGKCHLSACQVNGCNFQPRRQFSFVIHVARQTFLSCPRIFACFP